MIKSIGRPKAVPVHVLIVAADHMTGELLISAFNRVRNDFAFATAVGGSHEVIGELKSRNPQVALICADLQDGPNAGFRVLQSLRVSNRETAAIMLLPSSSSDSVIEAFRGGARGVFYRSDSLKSLSKCIRMVHQGQIWANNGDIQHILSALVTLSPLLLNAKDGHSVLTRREEEVVRLVAQGRKNREISQKLGVAEHTIRNYLSRIFEKLGVSTRVELILYAFNQRDKNN